MAWYDQKCPRCSTLLTGFTTLFCPQCDASNTPKRIVINGVDFGNLDIGTVIYTKLRDCLGGSNGLTYKVKIIAIVRDAYTAYHDVIVAPCYGSVEDFPRGGGYKVEILCVVNESNGSESLIRTKDYVVFPKDIIAIV